MIFYHKNGLSYDATLWIIIPILTLLGITAVRLLHGLMHNFETDPTINGTALFVLTTTIISLQVIIGFVGYFVMKEVGYFKDYIHGDKTNAGTPALICPGVAFMVFGMFFIHLGLVNNGIMEKFSIFYFIMMIPFVYVQILTIKTFFILKGKLFS